MTSRGKNIKNKVVTKTKMCKILEIEFSKGMAKCFAKYGAVRCYGVSENIFERGVDVRVGNTATLT